MNVPNTLSFIRFLLIPVFIVTFLMGSENSVYYIYAAAALVASGISDVLDGFFARLLHQQTELGKWLDPAADKTTLGAVCVCMWLRFREQIPELTFLLALHILKEVVMLVGGIILFRHSKIEPSHWWGKAATAIFYACMLLIMATAFVCSDPGLERTIIISLACFSTAATLFALYKYVRLGIKIKNGEVIPGSAQNN